MDKGTTDMNINAIPGKRRLRRALVRRLFSLQQNKDGVVSIEAALLFPVMILLLLGMIDITMLLSVQRKATVATSSIVDLVTQQSTAVSKAQIDQFIAAVDTILQPYTSQDIKIELFNYRPSGSNVVHLISTDHLLCFPHPSPSGKSIDTTSSAANASSRSKPRARMFKNRNFGFFDTGQSAITGPQKHRLAMSHSK